MKKDRYFYSIVSLTMLVLTGIGFSKFLSRGIESDDAPIPPAIKALVIIHGVALMLWIVTFFVQSVLIAVKNRKLHMTLGWGGAAVALMAVLTSPVMATQAVRLKPAERLFGMNYAQFLLVMYTEVLAFTVFVALAIAYRKKPAVHRSMVVLATLAVISGSTARIDVLYYAFGGHGWLGLFGVPLALGAVILAVRMILDRRFNGPFMAGYAALGAAYIIAFDVATGPWWTQTVAQIAK
jgi:hypothetical protein